MPEKVYKMKLPRKLDRRCKLSLEDIEMIRHNYKSGDFSLNQLAKIFDVSKRTILIYVNPESARKVKERVKATWRQYYDKEKHRKAIKKTRDYKKETLLKGGK